MSQFVIRRDTGLVGSASKVAVYVNGQKVTKLANNEIIQLQFTGPTARVQVGQSFMKSKVVQVQDGQVFRIKASARLAMLGLAAMLLNKPYLSIEIEE